MRSSFRRSGSASGFMTTERRLGLERPSLASMRVTTGRGLSNHHRGRGGAETDDDDDHDNHGYDSYYDDDDDEERKEREEERRLSERHGEAAEDADGSGPGKKRGNRAAGAANEADTDIAQEYAAQEKEKKKRKTGGHRSVTGDDLVKPNGLMAVHRGFPSKFHSGHAAVVAASSGLLNKKRNSKYPKTVSGMAKYSRHLLAQYSEWMDGLLPGLPLEEGTWKIYTLLSKTNVKQFVQQMRDEVRNQHVERVLGLEPAERLFGQYQTEILAATAAEADYEPNNDGEEETRTLEEDATMDDFAAATAEDLATPETDTIGPNAAPLRRSDVAVVTNPYGNNVTTNVATTASSSDRQGATMDGDDQETTQESPAERSLRSASQEAQPEVVATTVRKKITKKYALDDSSDEEEALFDDVIPAAVAGGGMEKKASKKRRVSVFQDDDGDDDDENDVEEKSEENDKEDKHQVGDEEADFQTSESKDPKDNSGVDNAMDVEEGRESSDKEAELEAPTGVAEERPHDEIADLPLTQLSEAPSVSEPQTQFSQAPTVHGSQLNEEDGAGLNPDWNTASLPLEKRRGTPNGIVRADTGVGSPYRGGLTNSKQDIMTQEGGLDAQDEL